MKDFDLWNKIQKILDQKDKIKFFKEREIWWCSVGLNIGSEENGKGNLFSRPVLIIKKHNRNCFLGVSITSSYKKNKYYFGLISRDKNYFAILSQIKLFSSARLINKVGKIDLNQFLEIKKAITQINLN